MLKIGSNKGKWTFHTRKVTVVLLKRLRTVRKKAWHTGKGAWRYKKRAWCSAILKGPRGNTNRRRGLLQGIGNYYNNRSLPTLEFDNIS